MSGSRPPSTTVDVANLKSGGFIMQRQADLFTVRVRTPMGRITAARLRALADIAERFGSGLVHLSIRQTPEIVGVPLDAFDNLVAALAEAGMSPASCGPRVRAASGCSGCEINPNGLVDTQALGLAMDARFFGTPCAAKFKLNFSGCPIDCTRAKCSDLGFVGMIEPALDARACTACGLCLKACKEGALSADADGIPVRDPALCTGCADCVKVCPPDAMYAARTGLAVYAGGKHGKRPRIPDHVADMLPEEEVPRVIERALEFYHANAARGERLAHVIERMGAGAFKDAVVPSAYRVDAGAIRQHGRVVD